MKERLNSFALTTLLSAVFGVSPAFSQVPKPLGCVVQAAGTPLIRAEGISEPVGDVLIGCTGGVPTAANENLRQVTIQVTTQPTINITSRPLGAGNFVDAMLFIDEPAPANQVLCGSNAYPYSVPVGSGQTVASGICGAHSGTGNGIGTYDPRVPPNPVPIPGGGSGATYRGNAYPARQLAPNSLIWEGIPFDPPGLLSTRVIRLSNIRVNASQLGVPENFTSIQLVLSTGGNVGSNSILVPLSNPTPTVATAQRSLGLSIASLQCGSGSCTCRNPANPPAVSAMTFRFSEANFPSSFRRRNDARPQAGSALAPPPISQRVLGVIYQTETGVYNPDFPSPYNTAGLADSGTRLYLRLSNVPSGVRLFTPETVRLGSVTARRIITDANGAGAFTAATGDSQSRVEMVEQNGGRQAVFEIVDSETTAFENLDVPVTVTYPGTPVSFAINSEGGYAPMSAAAATAIPSFNSPALATSLNVDVPGTCNNIVPPPPSSAGLYFVPVKPCRLVDTREVLPGGFGKPALGSGGVREFVLPTASCGLPAGARAYSLNFTVVPKGPLGYITTWEKGGSQPFVSTLNAIDGRVKANAAIVPANATDGGISVVATDATELVIDVNGYFVSAAATPQALAFYALPPCRLADTRDPNGNLGGPAIAAGASRSFPVLSANCGVPASAQAYSLNATVVPKGPLGYLTLWPAGEAQPLVSTLNSPKGEIVANAAIVPAGANGSISAFAQGETHLVLDINGYFAPPGAAGAQRYFAVKPCRLLDTREPASNPASLAGNESRNFAALDANCGLAANAAAYAVNATVVPPIGQSVGFLTLWPAGQQRPFVSTLNVITDPVVANAAMVPSGTAGNISIYVTDPAHIVLDVNGFFAP